MAVEELPFIQSAVSMCLDGWHMGWHERNAGNLSYRLAEDDVAAWKRSFETRGAGHAWQNLQVDARQLAGSFLLVSGAGRYFKNAQDAKSTFGICEFSESGTRFRVVWGLENGRPTSEFPTHVIAHQARMRATGEKSRVVYHAHCPNVIALSGVLPASSRVWTRTLWRAMTECVLFFPDGLGVVPWMVPGGSEIAVASGELLERHQACVWTQHGLFATGSDFDSTFGLAHMIEKTAGIYLQARAACGGHEPPFHVSDDQLLRICRESGVEPNRSFLQ